MKQLDSSAAIKFMNSGLFKAAEDGNMEPFNKYQGDLHCLVDGRHNTALHIFARTGVRDVVKTETRFLCFRKRRSEREFCSNFAEQLVDKCPQLLLQPNDKGEIPLHVAVQYDHHEIVKFLIERAKVEPREDLENGASSEATGGSWLRKIMTVKDKEGNTAFHKAAGSGNIVVVRLLVKELDPDFSFTANKMGETPLYIAAKRSRNNDVVAEILDKCKSIDYGGPDGTTALHAAVMRSGVIAEKLLEANKELSKGTDGKGRTPLHYAAYLGWPSMVNVLLEADASAAYVRDKERGMSALHMAALQGETVIMEAIISHCPGCCEIVDNRGWNFLHIAVATLLPSKIMNRFLHGIKHKIKDSTIINLLHEKDADGNTPLQMLISGAAGDNLRDDQLLWDYFFRRHSDLNYWDSDTKKEQIQKVLKDIGNNVEVVGVPVYQLREHMKKKEEEEKEISEHKILEKGRQTHLLVATLVATVTFSAAFTVPGGYKSDNGTAILSGDEAFKAFIVTNTVAFIFSLLAIFVHFLYPSLIKRGRHLLVLWLRLADCLTFLAMIAMVIAFTTGTYAVLKPSMGFAIVTCSLGLVFFPALLLASYLIFKN